MEQKFYLNRFIYAQDDGSRGATFEQALAEIKDGAKRSHWIWYVFPQIKGIPGTHSGNSLLYALSSREEVKAYMENETLGGRMREILNELLKHKGKNIVSIMGSNIDALKLRSSMTIFFYATHDPIFKEVIDTFYFGTFDHITTTILNSK